jgi:predicted lipoprotein
MNIGIRSQVLGLKNACLGACLLAACSSEAGGPKDAADAPARRVLLENMAKHVIAPTYADFVAKAKALTTATARYADTVSPENLSKAQTAFRDAIGVWQRAEMFQVGPAAAVGSSAPGGKGLRETIYAWPNAYSCGVDAALVDKAYADAEEFIASSYPNTRGLAALERLLFAGDADSACPSEHAIIKSGAWEALTQEDLDARRAAYANVLAVELQNDATKLKKQFATFARELATAGKGSKLFATTQDALNVVSDAMFYLDVATKDMKLAEPLGLTMACEEKRCPLELELALSLQSGQAVVRNLQAFRDLFQGLAPDGERNGEMWGFQDLLESLSQDKLATRMNNLIDKAIAETEKIEPSLEEVLASDAGEPASSARDTQADRAYAALQDLTTVLKTEFISALSLKLPVVAASDND